MRFARLFLLAVPLLLLPSAPARASDALAPHRAVYDLSMGEASDRSGITGIDGRMVYEFSGDACEGYTVTFRFVMRLQTDEMTRLSDQQTTTYEGGTGETFHFVNRIFLDNALDKEVKGVAERTGEATKIVLDKPVSRTQTLEKTQFPTAHMKELIAKAKSGERFYQTTLFDASDDADRVMMTAVTIGASRKATADDPESDALGPLAADRVWPVTIAYFDRAEGRGEETPDYTIGFLLHENGLTRKLSMNYGEFSIRGRLVDFEMFEDSKPQSCDG